MRSMYTTDTPYVIGKDIFEFDMASAGLSVIQKYGLLESSIIKSLIEMDKNNRNIAIGKYGKADKTLMKSINKYIKYEMDYFIKMNDINHADIISIKKDAIFTTKYPSYYTGDDYIVFVNKNKYTSYIKLPNRIEIYYNSAIVHVKGIRDDVINKHDNHILSFIYTMIYYLEINYDRTYKFIMEFVRKYKNRELESGYYREFNADSNIIFINTMSGHYSLAITDNLLEINSDMLEISYNYFNVILPFIKLAVLQSI